MPYSVDMCLRPHPEMTASEPLSLEEEYVMQATWRDDDDSKFPLPHVRHRLPPGLMQFPRQYPECTFIVLDKELPGAADFEASGRGKIQLILP
jgi:hypothetical protein